jgi:Flp pilus assembly protein TadD
MKGSVDIDRLQSNIAWAMKHGLGACDLIPMFEKLLAHSPAGSAQATFATLQLSELLVERAPWRAAVLATRILKERDEDRAWAILALAHTLLGNHRCARKAYQQALALAPGCASYAHNLGHLIDVIFNQPGESLALLATAYRAAPGEREIAASYAHALVRCGRWDEAKRVLRNALDPASDVVATLSSWLAASPPPSEFERTAQSRYRASGA